MNRRHVFAATAVAGLLLVTAALIHASIPAPGGVIHACYQKNVGNLRVIDTAVDSCRPDEVALSWSQTGPVGPIGPAGPTGAAGPTGPAGGRRPAHDPSVR